MTLSHHCTYINTKFSCTNVCSIRKQILFEVPRYANAAPIRGVDFNWRITNFHLTAPVRGVPLYIIFCLSWWHHSRIPYLFFPTCYNHSGQGWGRLLWNDYGWQCWLAHVLWICNQACAWICMSCMAYLTGCSWLCQNRIDSEKSHANNRTLVGLWCGMFKTPPGENFFSEGEFV